VLHDAFRASARDGFRIVEYCVMQDHVHLLVEANDELALSRGMQGFLVRLARGLNRAWKRRGSVLAERYHARILKSPREVRHALRYVLLNGRKHGVRYAADEADLFSSGPWFVGWCDVPANGLTERSPVADARTWLLGVGWLRHGRLSLDDVPGRRVPRSLRSGASSSPGAT